MLLVLMMLKLLRRRRELVLQRQVQRSVRQLGRWVMIWEVVVGVEEVR